MQKLDVTLVTGAVSVPGKWTISRSTQEKCSASKGMQSKTTSEVNEVDKTEMRNQEKHGRNERNSPLKARPRVKLFY